MKWTRAVQSATRKIGFDVTRYPARHPGYGRVKLLHHFDIDLVLDVGANTGQYGRELREHGYRGRLVSFEPLSEAYAVLASNAAKDDAWVAVHSALGERTGVSVANIAANSYSSSLLPMLPAHIDADPTSSYVSTENVSMVTLDSVFEEYWVPGCRPFLKIDTQGYEAPVLQGASSSLLRIVGVQLEMSIVPLYEGSMSFNESLREMVDAGFELARLEPGFEDPATGRSLQCDALFFREPTTLLN